MKSSQCSAANPMNHLSSFLCDMSAAGLGRSSLTKTKTALLGNSLMRLRMTQKKWLTVRSGGTRYFFLSMAAMSILRHDPTVERLCEGVILTVEVFIPLAGPPGMDFLSDFFQDRSGSTPSLALVQRRHSIRRSQVPLLGLPPRAYPTSQRNQRL